jgi:hypothetical protein
MNRRNCFGSKYFNTTTNQLVAKHIQQNDSFSVEEQTFDIEKYLIYRAGTRGPIVSGRLNLQER